MVRTIGDDSALPFRFYIFQDVLEELVFAARYDDRTYGAVLLGGFGIERGVGFIEITGFAGASWVDEVEALYASLRATGDERINSGEPDPIVGLFLSVPGCEGRATEEAARLHFSLFNIPFQPLLMLDPRSGQLSVVSRAPGTRLFNTPFRAVAVIPRLNDDGGSGKPEATQAEEE